MLRNKHESKCESIWGKINLTHTGEKSCKICLHFHPPPLVGYIHTCDAQAIYTTLLQHTVWWYKTRRQRARSTTASLPGRKQLRSLPSGILMWWRGHVKGKGSAAGGTVEETYLNNTWVWNYKKGSWYLFFLSLKAVWNWRAWFYKFMLQN